jgi:hypothetical protein
MGLSQNISFKYKDTRTLESFIKEFDAQYVITKEGGSFKITDAKNSFIFEIYLEPFGLYTHRSGEYFQFFGVLIENLSGEFGVVEIEDC